ncbi:sugar transferase [Loktanella sp. M215]|uniref:sugar transferase n=1 Tax=Loktanella sp. M215 TaxID=2675431 RepID=UPI001F20485F|nr:sugar transferase [Loktanella sp. M215]MCF7702185.1 sugar transferase [Loktanella sp. M215]
MTVNCQDLRHKSDVVIPQPSKNNPDPTARFYNCFGKRFFDVSLILLSLPFVLIVVALLAVVVARKGGKPFYTQDRVGRNGRAYKIWKLRTMVDNADALLEQHLAQDPVARAEWHITQKLRNDPRITEFGRFLRRSSMDELPQLWNVVRGDMSLIGPRPMMLNQTNLYPGTAYYDLRPGISGSWQISARNTSSFAERAMFDTDYREKISFVEDLRILFATLRVVLRGTGC